jgi:hypothetical protein
MSSTENVLNELLHRIKVLEDKKPIPGPQGVRGPCGDILAGERAIGARITESADVLKAASDQAVAGIKRLNDAVDAAVAKVNAIAEKVEDRLNTLNDRLSSKDFLDTAIIQVLIDYQIIRDGDVGDLLKHHMMDVLATATPEQIQQHREILQRHQELAKAS